MRTWIGARAFPGIAAWAVGVVEHCSKNAVVEASGDGLRSSATLHDDAAGDCLALGCMCILVGLPVGDRRAAMLVGIAGVVGGLARAVGFPIDDRRTAMLVCIAGLVGGRARAGVCPVGDRRAVMLAGIAGVVSGRACEG